MSRSVNPKKFFTKEEQERIKAAIISAEEHTSGEIRVHIERKCRVEPPVDRAKEVFFQKGMDKTEKKNGVLIYLATSSRRFAILGDEGIDELVPDNFWEDVRDLMSAHFKEDLFCEGIVEGISRVGEKLHQYFPWKDGDKNELTDELSFEKDQPTPPSDPD